MKSGELLVASGEQSHLTDSILVLLPTRHWQLTTLSAGPVVQRQGCLSYKQETMVRFHPGLLSSE